MKNYVFDIKELQEVGPIFQSPFGTFVGKRLIKWLSVEKVNKLYRRNMHFRGAEFTSSILKDSLVNIKYTIHNQQVLNNLPEGSFVTVSNHPIGSLDGVILIDIFASRRPDFKVMVNGILANIEAMEDNFISVVPNFNKQGANLENVNGLRSSFAWLKEGHPMGFFPSGAISCYNKEKKRICDNPWIPNIVRLIRKTKVPVYPVYFDFTNSSFFYWLGSISWKIRTFRVPAEVFNKNGQTLDVYLGDPIYPQEVQGMEDEEFAEFLYQKTYSAHQLYPL